MPKTKKIDEKEVERLRKEFLSNLIATTGINNVDAEVIDMVVLGESTQKEKEKVHQVFRFINIVKSKRKEGK